MDSDSSRSGSRERSSHDKKRKRDRKHDHSSRKHKSEKKGKKEKKEKRRRHDSSDEDETPILKRQSMAAEDAPPNASGDCPRPAAAAEAQEAAAAKPVSKVDFFNQLLQEENKKGQIGTAHAVGKDNGVAGAASGSNDWECPKCSTSNFKNSNQCQKCHALKRMSTYR